MAELTVILNFVIIFLLITAIVYGFVLNRRIKLIRESGRELSHLFRSFDDTILKAQVGVDDLKKISGQVSEGLQKKIDKAALIMDELEFLGEKASQAADKAGSAISNFKKIESRIPTLDKERGVVARPLITTPPKQVKSLTPLVFGQPKKKKALQDLLEEANESQQSNQNKSNDIKVKAGLKIQESKNNDEKQLSIASALKALGYGD